MKTELVAIGGSLGSMGALRLILAELPHDFPVPIAVVLHRHACADNHLVTALQQHCKLTVRDALDKEVVEPGVITLAPADYHLMIDEGHYALNTDEAVNAARPSIDLLFESVASNYTGAALGVILSGGGVDGAAGAAAIMRNDGEVLVENPLTAECEEMPAAAIKVANISEIHTVKELGKEILHRCHSRCSGSIGTKQR